MQIKILRSFHQKDLPVYQEILSLTRPIQKFYPHQPEWFQNTFLTGLKKGERLCVLAQDSKGKLQGCALLKNTPQEKKICTLFVQPELRRQGIATQLMDVAMQELGPTPLLTVAAGVFEQLRPLLEKYHFHWSATKHNDATLEYAFNDAKADAIREGLIPVLQKRIKQKS